jgi:hypothetical protein
VHGFLGLLVLLWHHECSFWCTDAHMGRFTPGEYPAWTFLSTHHNVLGGLMEDET